MSGNGNNQGGNDNKRKYIIIIIAAVVVIAAMAGVIIYLLTQRKAPETSGTEVAEKEKRTVLVTEDNVEEVIEQMIAEPTEEEAEIPMSYTATMNSRWHFDKGDAESDDAYVANNANNTTDMYFDVVRNDTEEIIYSSPVIPVGGDIRKFKLDKALEPGVYECTIIYYLVDSDQNVLTTVNMWVEITVDN